MFGLCFAILTRGFAAFPLLLELGLGSSSACLYLSSLPTDRLVVISTSANATLLAPCWASSLFAITAVTFAASITLPLAPAYLPPDGVRDLDRGLLYPLDTASAAKAGSP